MIRRSSILRDSQSGASVTFAAPGQGKYNCVAAITVFTTAEASLTITSGGTTLFSTTLPASTGLEKVWGDHNPLIGLENQSVVIAVSAGTYTINAGGFVTP